MKRFNSVVLVLILIVLLLALCSRKDAYTLSQPYPNVVNVEIVYVANDMILVKGFYDSIEPICALEAEQIDAFFDKFNTMACSRYLNDPAESVTGEVIRVTYRDGAFELIGHQAGFYCAKDKNWNYRPYYFDDEVFYQFISMLKS